MSTGHLKYEKKSDAELYKMLGQGDTPKLYARPVKLITSKSIPYGGGTSVDGKHVYIDEILYAEIMCRRFIPRAKWVIVRGMSPAQVVHSIIEHEHTEFSVDAGENPVDVYEAAHEYAVAKEHRFVRQLGVDPDYYEAKLKPALDRCLARYPADPPKDLWCGPYLDKPTPRDREIIRILKQKGVVDASKLSKEDVGYGIGEEECRRCAMFECLGRDLSTCSLVSGLVRANRHCERWTAKGAQNG
jgi:hypothetical protein